LAADGAAVCVPKAKTDKHKRTIAMDFVIITAPLKKSCHGHDPYLPEGIRLHE